MADSSRDLAASLVRATADYDSVPYASHPIVGLHPARLLAVATFFGLPAPDLRRARVLEIGCAAGGHLIPLAATWPHAQFVGVDLSPVQIGDGAARIARLGLRNIELQCRSLTELGEADGLFDVIIAHGVYSWVPDAVREALLEVTRQRLSPDGIAAITYNVNPGWRLYQALRDCALLYAGRGPDMARSVARTREFFSIMHARASEHTVYGRVWREQAERVAALPDSHIAHDLLEEYNTPSTFAEFTAAAATHGLGYLGEAHIFTMFPEASGEDYSALVRQMSHDQASVEQMMDMMSGRSFRQSLLVHAGRASGIDWRPDPARLMECHFIADARLRRIAAASPDAHCFEAGPGTQTTVANPVVAAALDRLIARLPASSALDDMAPEGIVSIFERGAILAGLTSMVIQGLLTLSSEPVACGLGVPLRPRAWPLAVSDAMSGAQVTAGLHHVGVKIDGPARFLLPLMNGERDRTALVGALLEIAKTGELGVTANGRPVTDVDRLTAICDQTVNACARRLAEAGVFVEAA